MCWQSRRTSVCSKVRVSCFPDLKGESSSLIPRSTLSTSSMGSMPNAESKAETACFSRSWLQDGGGCHLAMGPGDQTSFYLLPAITGRCVEVLPRPVQGLSFHGAMRSWQVESPSPQDPRSLLSEPSQVLHAREYLVISREFREGSPEQCPHHRWL